MSNPSQLPVVMNFYLPGATSNNTTMSSLEDRLVNSLLSGIDGPGTLTGINGICTVCGDYATGKHYGTMSCEGCKGFFKRSIRRELTYTCRNNGNCEVTKDCRNRCQHCRLKKCLRMGMNTSNAVQYQRKPLQPVLAPSPDYFCNGNSNVSPRPSKLIKLGPSPSALYEQQGRDMRGLDRMMPQSGAAAPSASSSSGIGQRDEIEDESGSEEANSSIKITSVSGNYGHSSASTTDAAADPLGGSELPVMVICEQASKLLFKTITWISSLPCYKALDLETQLAITKSAWNELFILGLTQTSSLNDQDDILKMATNKAMKTNDLARQQELAKVQGFVNTGRQLNMDEFESTALRLLLLFSPDRVQNHGTDAVEAVTEYHADISEQLVNHVKQVRKEQSDNIEDGDPITTPSACHRIADLLLLLPQLRSFKAEMIDDLFFSDVFNTAEIPITLAIPNIIKMVTTPGYPDGLFVQENQDQNLESDDEDE